MNRDDDKIRKEFAKVVNMGPAELESWLQTAASRSVGWKGRDGRAKESVGHASGRSIVQILRKTDDELTQNDLAHMRKVVGFVHRHCAQRPQNIYTSRWRYSLMNWGHDPLKEGDS